MSVALGRGERRPPLGQFHNQAPSRSTPILRYADGEIQT